MSPWGSESGSASWTFSACQCPESLGCSKSYTQYYDCQLRSNIFRIILVARQLSSQVNKSLSDRKFHDWKRPNISLPNFFERQRHRSKNMRFDPSDKFKILFQPKRGTHTVHFSMRSWRKEYNSESLTLMKFSASSANIALMVRPMCSTIPQPSPNIMAVRLW